MGCRSVPALGVRGLFVSELVRWLLGLPWPSGHGHRRCLSGGERGRQGRVYLIVYPMDIFSCIILTVDILEMAEEVGGSC